MNKNYFLYELKKKAWISGFFIACLTIGYVLVSGVSYEYNDIDPESLLFSVFLISSILYSTFLFLTTLYQFSFFHTKQKVDIYLQMPISRKKLIISNYFIVPILITIPYLLVNVISFGHAIVLAKDFPYYSIYSELGDWVILLIKTTVVSLFLYSLMVYLATKTGKTIAHAFITLATIVAPMLIYIFTLIVATETINLGFGSDTYLNYLAMFFFYFNDEYILYQIVCLVLQIIGIIILPILTVKSFEKYKAENTDKFLTSDRLNSFYLVLISVSVAIFSTLIVISITRNYNFMFLTIMFMAIALIIFGITTSIFNMSVSIKNFKVKNVVALLAVCFVYSLVMFDDVLGLGASTPNINNVESVYIDHMEVSMEDINKVIDLQIKASMTGSTHSDINYGYSTDYLETFEPDMFVDSLDFTYNMKDGSTFRRIYYLPLDTVLYDDLTAIYTSENYKQSYIDNIYEAMDYYTDFNVEIGNKSFNISDVEGLCDALIKDIEADENFGYYTYAPLRFININANIDYENHEDSYKVNAYYSIGADYKNTIDFINSEYEKMYGEGASIFDNIELTSYQDLNQTLNMSKIKDESIQYLPDTYYYTNIVSDNIEDYDFTTYSYDENPEEFMEFVNGDFYTNNLMPTTGDKVYGVVFGEFKQYENDYPIAYFVK